MSEQAKSRGADNDGLELDDEPDPEIDALGELFAAHSSWLSEQINRSAHISMCFTTPPTFSVDFLKGAEEKEVPWPQPWIQAKQEGRIQLSVTRNNEYARKHSSSWPHCFMTISLQFVSYSLMFPQE
jgi:hypothetical protein